MPGLEGRVALVTGGSRGIGAAVAERLAQDGADVAVVARRPAAADSLLERVRQRGRRALALRTDVTDEAQSETMVRRVVEELGRLDILVASAGTAGQTCPFHRLELAEWERVMRVNLTGVFLSCRAALRPMLEQGSGRIITIASRVGQALSPVGQSSQPNRSPHYALSKAGVITFTRLLALEVARHGVTVNAVSPGPTRTAMLTETTARELVQQDHIPLGRIGEASDVAAAVAYLASDEAAWVTGQAIGVNGGAWVM